MTSGRFTEEHVIGVLKEAKGGMEVSYLCRQNGISEGIYYRWKSRYGGKEVSDIRRLKSLEEENRRLKQLVADKELSIRGLRAALAKNN